MRANRYVTMFTTAVLLISLAPARVARAGGESNTAGETRKSFLPAGGATYTVTNTNNSGPGSLREAIIAANSGDGTPTVIFNIAGDGVRTIDILSALPTITVPTFIDGTTQPGFAGSPLIELNGSGAGDADGIAISSGGSRVRSLIINRFARDGISLSSGGGNVIEGCYIGVKAAGNVAAANGDDGVQVYAPDTLIGGTTAASRNIISGNGQRGIEIGFTQNVTIQGNYIGTDAAGTAAIPNLDEGIRAEVFNSNTPNVLIGGTAAGGRNVVSGNTNNGIHIQDSVGATVQGNYIGTDATGNASLPNGSIGIIVNNSSNFLIGGTASGAGNAISGNNGSGIMIFQNSSNNVIEGNLIGVGADGASPVPNLGDGILFNSPQPHINLVGGTAAGASNVIANNSSSGIRMLNGHRNALRANSIFGNGALGIDLDPEGVTANDPGDVDGGPNDLQNFPVISAAVSGPATVVRGTLNSTATANFDLDFFTNPSCDVSEHGEGRTYLGSVSVTTDGGGNAMFDSALAGSTSSGEFVTATATSSSGSTSEFSACVLSAPAVTPTPTPVPPSVNFSSATYTEDESQILTINLIRTGDLTETSTVAFQTSGGTAAGGDECSPNVDFISVSQNVVFGPGEEMQPVSVILCADGIREPAIETAGLSISGPDTGQQNSAVLNINDTANAYRNPAPVQFNDASNTPPSSITVTGGPGVIGGVRVTLFDVWHMFPDDIDVLLVGPGGQSYVVMGDAGGPFSIGSLNAVTLTFEDFTTAVLPDSAPLVTGKFEPTTWESPVSSFQPPAPAGPYAEPGSVVGGPIETTMFGTFGLTNSNGVWQLFVRDDGGTLTAITGEISGGWGIEFLTPTAALASISGRVTTADGIGIRNAEMVLTGNSLEAPMRVTTSSFGYFNFDGLSVGETYVLTVNSRRYIFAKPSQVISLMDHATDINFVAEGP